MANAVLGAYFVADRFSNGFVQDVSRLVEPINRNRTDRFEIRVCVYEHSAWFWLWPAVSAQAAPVNINVGITIKKPAKKQSLPLLYNRMATLRERKHMVNIGSVGYTFDGMGMLMIDGKCVDRKELSLSLDAAQKILII